MFTSFLKTKCSSLYQHLYYVSCMQTICYCIAHASLPNYIVNKRNAFPYIQMFFVPLIMINVHVTAFACKVCGKQIWHHNIKRVLKGESDMFYK